MLILELTYPGTWIDLPDQHHAFELGNLLRQIEGAFADATLALNLFYGAQARLAATSGSAGFRQEWEEKARRRQQLMEQHLGSGLAQVAVPMALRDEISERIEVEIKRERWAAGVLPQAFELKLPIMHARSFVFALDTLVKILTVLSGERDVPAAVGVQLDALRAAFPKLIGVRDTAHHPEDRARGLDKRGQPLKLQPIDTPLVKAPHGGVIMLDSLHGNNYTCTLNDGSLGEVEVSEASLRVVQTCVQRVFEAFTWKGRPLHVPL